VVGPQSPQRIRNLTQNAVAAGIAEDLAVSPLEPGFGGDDDARAQLAFGNSAADDFFGAAKSISRRGVDQIDPAFDGGINRLDRLLFIRPAPHPAPDRPGPKADARYGQACACNRRLFHIDIRSHGHFSKTCRPQRRTRP
jgi:hypothetical protein